MSWTCSAEFGTSGSALYDELVEWYDKATQEERGAFEEFARNHAWLSGIRLNLPTLPEQPYIDASARPFRIVLGAGTFADQAILECTAGSSRNPVCARTKMDECLPPGQAFF